MEQEDSGEGMDARSAQDSLIEEALVEGLRYSEVAEFARCSERTVRRRMDIPEFKSRVEARRAERTMQMTSRLGEAGWSAIDVLMQELEHPDPRICLRAAQMLLTLGSRFRRDVEFAERIEGLEHRLDSLFPADGDPEETQ